MKLRILVDMDDTIENLGETWVNFLNERYGLDVKWSEIEDWDLHKAFPTLDEMQIYDALFEAKLWARVRPFDGAVDSLKWMIDEGHDVYIVTASHPGTVYEKFELVLQRYFPFITPDKLIVIKNKQMLNADILIDDAPHNLIDGGYGKILMTAPHNKKYDAEAHDMIRVKNWDEIIGIIKYISAV